MTNLGNYGERQDSAVKDWGYYAHLSIYQFAARHAKGVDCLDVGCGTGYGADHLRAVGARSVTALDKDAAVIEVLRGRYPGVGFHAADLDMTGIPVADRAIDLVFSSNVFEHIAYIDPVLKECHRVLRAGGRAVIAVPPIITPGMLIVNAKNVFHINNIPPWSWKAKLSRYFQEVEYYRHWVRPERIDHDGLILMDQAGLDDFIFQTDPEFTPNTITSVFACALPRDTPLAPESAEACPDEWLPLKLEADARQAAFVELQGQCEDTVGWWKREVTALSDWVEGARREGVAAEVIVDAVSRQLGHLRA